LVILLFAILESKTKTLHFPQQVFQEKKKIRIKGITPCTENNPINKIKQEKIATLTAYRFTRCWMSWL